MSQTFDVAIVGAGILGLAHAWMATRRGLSVLLLERTAVPQGATIRNFGMIWPIGQPAGEPLRLAMRSRELWLEMSRLANLPIELCGSIHAAHRPDELAVLEEFVSCGTHQASMISATEVRASASLVNSDGLLGGMHSPWELRVNPRVAASAIVRFLKTLPGLSCEFSTCVRHLEGRKIMSSDGRCWSAARILVCSGSDLQSLYPAEFAASGLKLCKLQMFRIQLPAATEVIPHIASGLTLRHYKSFEACPSLQALRARVQHETPELDKYGIHVMASVFDDGQIILGDSHEYGEEIEPFEKAEIDHLMLRELKKVIQLDHWNVDQHWHGIYAKHPQDLIFEKQVTDEHTLFTGSGGAGMTLAFALAEQSWLRWMGGFA